MYYLGVCINYQYILTDEYVGTYRYYSTKTQPHFFGEEPELDYITGRSRATGAIRNT